MWTGGGAERGCGQYWGRDGLRGRVTYSCAVGGGDGDTTLVKRTMLMREEEEKVCKSVKSFKAKWNMDGRLVQLQKAVGSLTSHASGAIQRNSRTSLDFQTLPRAGLGSRSDPIRCDLQACLRQTHGGYSRRLPTYLPLEV
jgi:hypothetical protein